MIKSEVKKIKFMTYKISKTIKAKHKMDFRISTQLC